MANILFLDLDNTLAPTGAPVSQHVVERLRRIARSGTHLVLCSGKPAYYLSAMARQMDIPDFILASENGAVIQFGNDLPPKEVSVLSKNPAALTNIKKVQKLFDTRFEGRFWQQPNTVNCTVFWRDETEYKAIKDFIDTLPKKLLSGLRVFENSDSFDITPDVDKGDAVEFIANHFGCTRDQIAAIGDAPNDYPMFKKCGVSIGIRVPEVAKVAYTVDSIDEALDIIEHGTSDTDSPGTAIEVYVPVLLNFADNGIVYTTQELDTIKAALLSPENGIALHEPHHSRSRFDEVFSHYLQDSGAYGKDSEARAIQAYLQDVSIYHYHHRVILRYTFESISPRLERDIRLYVHDHSMQVIEEKIILVSNSLNIRGDTDDVLSYYSYVVMFIKNNYSFQSHITNFLGSHTFRIIEPINNILRYARHHYVRISIPSTNIYYDKMIGYFLKIDILNAIYLHLLYKKKQLDAADPKLQKRVQFDSKLARSYNHMQEAQLQELWAHFTDSLGGKTIDSQHNELQSKAFLLSILALILAIVSIAVSFVP